MLRTEDEYLNEVLRLERPLRAVLHRFAPQPADLEDLLQETYSRLFSIPPDRRAEIRSVQAFAITIARNVALDWLRRHQVVGLEAVGDIADWPAAETAELEEIVHTHQQLLRIAAGLDQLSDKCREVFTLRRIHGLSQKEIAARLGLSEGAVEQHLIRGLKRCTELLRESESAHQVTMPRRKAGLLQRLRKRIRNKESPG